MVPCPLKLVQLLIPIKEYIVFVILSSDAMIPQKGYTGQYLSSR